MSEKIGRIHGLCIVKNEADVLESALLAASAWCDHIYVFDNGSTDGTWEIVQRLAKTIPAVIPYRQDTAKYSEGLRSEIFNAFKDRTRPGDWWTRLDADEFYLEDPRIFLTKVKLPYGIVWNASISYYFSSEDAEQYVADPSSHSGIFVRDRLRHYLSHWSEIRFLRHHPDLHWPNGTLKGWPLNMADIYRHYPGRIVLQHYAYRSPKQIEQRVGIRVQATNGFSHESWKNWAAAITPRGSAPLHLATSIYPEGTVPTGWENRVVPAGQLDFDNGDRRFVIREDMMPVIPGTEPKTWKQSRLLNNVLVNPFKAPVKAALRALQAS